MKPDLLEWLAAGVVVGDGAMGTLLYERGLPLDRCCEELILTEPGMVRKIHEEYAGAGAQMVETNTFGGNRIRLARHGLEGKVHEINTRAVALAREAVGGKKVLVAGSVGPLGLRMDEIEAQGIDARAVFTEQVTALLEGGVDFLLMETFSDPEELKIALAAAKALSKGPFVCSMSFTEDGVTHRGAVAANAFAAIQADGAHVLGGNCCVGPRSLSTLFRTQVPPPKNVHYSAFPNAGRPELVEGRYYYPTTHAYFAARGLELVRNGVRLIGGCCGTTPEHIAVLRQALQSSHPATTTFAVGSPASPPAPVEARFSTAGVAEPTLLDIIQRRTLIVTEFDSPKTLSLDAMIEAARALKAAGTDFMTVADNSLAILRMNGVIAAHLTQRETGLPMIVHLACRDRNLIGTQSELMGMDALGLDHVLALTGDPSKVGDSPGATSVYDLNSISLLEGIRAMNSGRTFGGRDLQRPTRFVAGCAFNPNVTRLDAQLKRLERKVAAGAQFVMTQPIFNPSQAKIVADATRAFGIPVLVGVMPLLSARNAEFLHNEVPGITIPDDIRERMRGKEGDAGVAEGVAIARTLAAEVLRHFKGIYLITPFVRYQTTEALSMAIRSGKL